MAPIPRSRDLGHGHSFFSQLFVCLVLFGTTVYAVHGGVLEVHSETIASPECSGAEDGYGKNRLYHVT